jgi:hypothetical protein
MFEIEQGRQSGSADLTDAAGLRLARIRERIGFSTLRLHDLRHS